MPSEPYTHAIGYTPAGDIDGEPQEVAEQATRELAVILLEVEEIIQATVRQVENAGRQHALDEGVESPEGEGALDEWWRNRQPVQAARAEALRIVAEKLPAAARSLNYAVSRGE